MMDQQTPVLKDLVLIGGGHAHVHVLKMLGMKPIPGVRISLVTSEIETPYSGMVIIDTFTFLNKVIEKKSYQFKLPGHISGEYRHDECHIDLGRLASFSGARLIHCSATRLDLSKKLIYCSDGRPPLQYDVLSINIGITPR